MNTAPKMNGIPMFIYDKLAGRSDYKKFIDQACAYGTANGASRSCINYPEKFFSTRIPDTDKLAGTKGWNRVAQEISRAFLTGGSKKIAEIINEVKLRRNRAKERRSKL